MVTDLFDTIFKDEPLNNPHVNKLCYLASQKLVHIYKMHFQAATVLFECKDISPGALDGRSQDEALLPLVFFIFIDFMFKLYIFVTYVYRLALF